jgi:hypothetical protein
MRVGKATGSNHCRDGAGGDKEDAQDPRQEVGFGSFGHFSLFYSLAKVTMIVVTDRRAVGFDKHAARLNSFSS